MSCILSVQDGIFPGLHSYTRPEGWGRGSRSIPPYTPRNGGDDAIDIRLYRQADFVFCQSNCEKNHLERLGVPSEKLLCTFLPPMCRTDGLGSRLRSALEVGNRPTALFLGRRDEGKGYPALLRAWIEVLQKIPEAVLVLAGPGDPHAAALEQIPPGSLRDLGVPDERTKADALAACDVFCLPSAHESFGIVYVEAWSYGKPVICGTASASRELVEDGITGLWADQNPRVLAGHLVTLLADGKMGKRLGNAGLSLQRSRYTNEAMVRVHLHAFGMN